MPRIEQSRLFYYYFFFISVLMELLIFALTRKSPHHRILDVIVLLICFSILKNNNNDKIRRMLFYSLSVAAKRTKQRKREKNLKETPRCTILSCNRVICFSFRQSFQVSANVHLVGLYMAVW